MQISRLVMLQICMSLVVYHGSCKSLNIDLTTEDTEALSQLTDEEDTKSRVANFLETMKETFLRKLNLSDVPQEKTKVSPPQFMMELYNKYASNSTAAPQSDVIRSFTVQDISLNAINGTRSKHRLIFNITIPCHEKITAAELQLFFLPGSKYTSKSFQGTIKVYDMNTTQLLIGRELSGFGNMWETFDVTLLIQNWMKSGHGITGFDIVVDRSDCEDFNMSVSFGDNTSAALIVFSDDLGSRRKEAKKELKEMILHEEESILDSDTIWKTKELPNETNPRRRKRETEYCHRTSLKVNFKEIGWDSWIVAPPEYDAFECRGLCYHPLTDESSPSKHALIQAILNIKNPKKANMACCVPIKLDPITVMYKENGRLTIRYLYEEMKVAQCGCR